MATNDNRKRFNIIANKNESLILVSLFAFSFLIRAIGLKHGFPLLLHPDEGVILDMAFFKSSEGFFFPGNPGNFIRPNQILYTLNFIFLNFMSYLRFGEPFAARYLLYELHFYHYARFLIAVMGSMLPVLAYLIGKLFKQSFALAAGVTFLVFPSYVLHSLYVTPDVPITLFTLLVLYFTLRYLEKNEKLSLFIAVIFAAINTAEKYPGLLSLLIILAGILLKASQNINFSFKKQIGPVLKISVSVLLVFILSLFLFAPNLFIHFQMAKVGFLHSSRSTHSGADYYNFFGRLWFYINAFASWSNILALIWLIAGLFALIKWRNRNTLLFFYGVFYWISLSVLPLHWERWALPMYITPLFLIAIGISFLWNKYKTVPQKRWVFLVLLAFFFLQQAIMATHTSISHVYTDTRVLALEYSQVNGITPENSLFEGYTPFQTRQGPKTIFSDYEQQRGNFEYIILSSGMYERFFREPSRYIEEISFYESLREEHQLIASFEPDQMATTPFAQLIDIINFMRHSFNPADIDKFRGPVIEIFQVIN